MINKDKDRYIDDYEEDDMNGFDENDDEDTGDEDTGDDVVSELDDDDFDLIHRFNTNKHRQEGKHKLNRDTIFKGKKDKNQEDNEFYEYGFEQDDYSDAMKLFNNEMNTDDDYINQNNLTKDVYGILDEMTDLDFTQNRRKPNKESFNLYYNLLLRELGIRYTKSEIFVELAYYFTDNIFNMFKLLDKVPATIIIKELIQKGYLKDLSNINFS